MFNGFTRSQKLEICEPSESLLKDAFLCFYTVRYLSRCMFLEKATQSGFSFVQVFLEVTGDSLSCKGKRKAE